MKQKRKRTDSILEGCSLLCQETAVLESSCQTRAGLLESQQQLQEQFIIVDIDPRAIF